MLPVPRFLARTSCRRSPSVFHLHWSDRFFAGCCWIGLLLSAAALGGLVDRLPLPAWMAVWAVLWVLYLSIVNVGQVWYGFGWESLLLETGFLAIFLGNADTAPPWPILLALRWLLFRLEVGAGLIKLRGDPCWRDLTCLYYHHETQPMPGPLSWYFHHLPRPLHKVEVAANHVTQLVVPFLLFTPQPVAGVAAAIVIVTQLWLVLSGNFSWLNWLALILAIPVLPGGSGPEHGATPRWFVVVGSAGAALGGVLSYWPGRNLLGPPPAEEAAVHRLHPLKTHCA